MTAPPHRFPRLFSPIDIGEVTVKNRVVVSPHGTFMAERGVMAKRYADYVIQRITGGAGLVIMSYGLSDPLGPEGGLISTWRRENIERLRPIVDAAHAHDCRLFFQFGESNRHSGLGPSSSGGKAAPWYRARPMTIDDISRMQHNYIECALVLQEAGLDGIELHGHGDLFSDFLSPVFNQRQDEYGGSFENRLRYLRESIAGVRSAIGPSMVIGHRLSVDDGIPGSIALAEGVAIATELDRDGGIDYLNIDIGVEPELLDRIIAPLYTEPGHQRYAAAAVKAAVNGLPVICVGRITTPELAERVIELGQADLVAMARALIADPELPNKAAAGRVDEIRPCLGDNQECIGRVSLGRPMRCTVNPEVGREREWSVGTPRIAEPAKRVLVAGGGPAGLETAWVAAARGHEVTLCERAELLGGQVLLGARLPGRSDIGKIAGWHSAQLQRFGVDVRTATGVTTQLIDDIAPDVLVIATGAAWDAELGFPLGPGAPAVMGLADAIVRPPDPGGTVVVLDSRGFVEGPGVAELLASDGRQVHLVTRLGSLTEGWLAATMQSRHVVERLRRAGVEVSLGARAVDVQGSTLTIADLATEDRAEVPNVGAIVVVGGRSRDQSVVAGPARSAMVLRIGDCRSPGDIGASIRDGRRAGMAI